MQNINEQIVLLDKTESKESIIKVLSVFSSVLLQVKVRFGLSLQTFSMNVKGVYKPVAKHEKNVDIIPTNNKNALTVNAVLWAFIKSEDGPNQACSFFEDFKNLCNNSLCAPSELFIITVFS